MEKDGAKLKNFLNSQIATQAGARISGQKL